MERTDKTPAAKRGPWWESFFYFLGAIAGWLAHAGSGM